jgi:hypothetical protein
MSHEIDRRTALRIVAASPIAAALAWTEPEVAQAQRRVATALAAGEEFVPQFFTPAEWQMVRRLSDLIVPRDARSGSATDVGVPEFMDFMMIDQPGRQTAMRGGLAWVDRECVTRFDKTFLACTTAERTGVLDDIAWPRKAPAAVSHGVAFFNAFRDLTASGFWTSRMGIKDLDYRGNVFVPEWTGCPDAVLKKLGVG